MRCARRGHSGVGIDADRRRARRLEAHLDVEHADQAADQQARAHQQHAGERDLRHDERAAHPGAAAAFGRPAGRVLQRVVQRRAWRLQRRRQAEHDAGDDRDDHREAERGAVDAHVAQQRNADGVELARAGACRRARAPGRAAAPLHDSTRPSVSICAISRPRPAPSAVRIAISFCRAAVRASSRFERFAHTISITIADRAGEHPARRRRTAADVLGQRLHESLRSRCAPDAPG